jgi:hypothetical protein
MLASLDVQHIQTAEIRIQRGRDLAIMGRTADGSDHETCIVLPNCMHREHDSEEHVMTATWGLLLVGGRCRRPKRGGVVPQFRLGNEPMIAN